MADELTREQLTQLGNVFGDLFGTSRGQLHKDQTQVLQVDLAGAADGTTRHIEIERFFACGDCHGRGAPEDVDATDCPDCGGAGGHEQRQGALTLSTICATCSGRGVLFDRACKACEGARGRTEPETITVTVPGGVESGHRLRIDGKGNELRDGTGDLYLQIVVDSDPQIARDGNDLHVYAAVDRQRATEGGHVEVPIPGGKARIRVPAGTDNGDLIELRGRGALKLGAKPTPRPAGEDEPYRTVDASESRGSLVVTVCIQGERHPFPHHAVLGVLPGSTHAQIHEAYRLRMAGAASNVGQARALQIAYEALGGTPAPSADHRGVILFFVLLAIAGLFTAWMTAL